MMGRWMEDNVENTWTNRSGSKSHGIFRLDSLGIIIWFRSGEVWRFFQSSQKASVLLFSSTSSYKTNKQQRNKQ